MAPCSTIVFVAAITLGGCRPNATKALAEPAPTLNAVAGWWSVAGDKDRAYWFSTDSVRVQTPAASRRIGIARAEARGPVLRLTLEEGQMLLTAVHPTGAGVESDAGAPSDAIAVRMSESDPAVTLRHATDAELRAFEKRDAKLAAKVEAPCEKALACCEAAVGQKLAVASDCAPLISPPEIGRCVRALELFRKKLPGCAK